MKEWKDDRERDHTELTIQKICEHGTEEIETKERKERERERVMSTDFG